MTKGQALYRATAKALGLDPDRHGVQAEMLAYCDDISTQSRMSAYKTGRGNPDDETVAAFEQRFGFALVAPSEAWGFVVGGGGEE